MFMVPKVLMDAHQVYITKNEHNTNYESILSYLSSNKDLQDFDEDILKRCIETNILWEIQWYPITPISFYKVYGDTLDTCFRIINENSWE